MAGMSMDALAKASGAIVSKQAISKYEKGKANPGSEILIALAGALDVKVDYFFRPETVQISGFSFRKKSRLTKKEEDRIRHQTIDFLQKFLELEEILNIPHTFDNPIPAMVIHNQQDIEDAAAAIRQNWKLGEAPIPQLTELLEDHGYKVLEVDADSNFVGLSGFSDDPRVPVITVNKNGDCVRRRFTLAHELAHLLLDLSDCSQANHESLCHAFAGALLMPENVIRDAFGGERKKMTEWELKKLKGIFGISMQAIMARAKKLGLITEHHHKVFCMNVSKNGWKKKEPGEYSGIEKANRFKQLVIHAAAEELITYSRGAEFLDVPLTEFEQEVHIVS